MFVQLRSVRTDGEDGNILKPQIENPAADMDDVSICCRTEGVLCWLDAAEAPVTQQHSVCSS